MEHDLKIRRKALRAARAVTAGALIFAGVACSDVEEPNEPGSGWDIGESEADVSQADSGQADSGQADSGQADSGQADSGQADSGPQCVNPNDPIDCCELVGGGETWEGCAVPGPFVPPKMAV